MQFIYQWNNIYRFPMQEKCWMRPAPCKKENVKKDDKIEKACGFDDSFHWLKIKQEMEYHSIHTIINIQIPACGKRQNDKIIFLPPQ